MSNPISQDYKRMKRSSEIFNLHSFCNPGCPIGGNGPFRDNIRVFLQEYAELENYTVQGMRIWRTLLVHNNCSMTVPLYTIEEDVKSSENPFCDLCQCAGWSNHFVSKRKYHMIIPVDDEWRKPLVNDALDLPTHLLHGLMHCNGFAHLVSINGLKGGSKHLYGREIMDLWDRICTSLRTRKISVEDASNKRSMDLRLLHGVAYGHYWFGRWGYQFSYGSFGMTKDHYDQAIESLSSLPLERILEDFIDMDEREELKQIISYYRNLSETKLITIKDLIHFMLTVKPSVTGQKKSLRGTAAVSSFTVKRATKAALRIKPSKKEKSARCKKFSTIIARVDCNWPTRRLEFAADVIVKALQEKKESGQSVMTRQDVRDAARSHIGDTGLLDYVLKSMNNVIVGNHIVCRAVNPATRVLEYTIHDLADGVKVSEPAQSFQSATLVPGVDVYNDVLYLYEHVLLEYPESEQMVLATQRLLGAKHFVKECSHRDDEEQSLTIFCQLLPSLTDMEFVFKRELPPGEVVVLPLHATVRELKRAAESALRDTYFITERFEVMAIEGLDEMEDTEPLFGVAESGVVVGVRGSGIDLDTPLRYEGGSDIWIVSCDCGATDDDGERMVACDLCEVWQHTRCRGIEDADTVPPVFFCSACCAPLASPTYFL
ncbi:hypothetical protein TB1_024946 [Malus domestica]